MRRLFEIALLIVCLSSVLIAVIFYFNGDIELAIFHMVSAIFLLMLTKE